jgi:hypothetical protein
MLGLALTPGLKMEIGAPVVIAIPEAAIQMLTEYEAGVAEVVPSPAVVLAMTVAVPDPGTVKETVPAGTAGRKIAPGVGPEISVTKPAKPLETSTGDAPAIMATTSRTEQMTIGDRVLRIVATMRSIVHVKGTSEMGRTAKQELCLQRYIVGRQTWLEA